MPRRVGRVFGARGRPHSVVDVVPTPIGGAIRPATCHEVAILAPSEPRVVSGMIPVATCVCMWHAVGGVVKCASELVLAHEAAEVADAAQGE